VGTVGGGMSVKCVGRPQHRVVCACAPVCAGPFLHLCGLVCGALVPCLRPACCSRAQSWCNLTQCHL
jgi:hypothetical protein